MNQHQLPFRSQARRPLRLTLTLLSAASLVALSGGVAFGMPTRPENKQQICHATDSDTNPYVVNTPAKSGDLHGHAGHTGPIWSSGLKAQHIHWGDIIPAFDYNDHGTTKHFLGLNWTNTGKAWFYNHCKVPPVLSVSVDKTNDANGDATFTNSETTLVPGADVPFKVVVTNTSAVTVVVDSITDAVGATNIPITCAPALVGTSLAPGASATCSFTVDGYSPPDGQSKTNTATVVVHQDQNPFNTGSGSDTSDVATAVPVLSLTVVKTNDANGDESFSASETAGQPGQDVPYRVVVTNTSAVTVALDGLTDVVGAASSVPVTCTSALPATLAAGASATCDFTLAGSSPAAGTSVTDTVTATEHQIGNPGNSASAHGSSTVDTAAAPVPDLSIVKSGPASVAAGDNLTWSLVVTNDGTAPAPVVTVTDSLPAGVDPAAVAAAGWTCTGSTSLSCTLNGPLAAGATASLTVTVTVPTTYTAANVSNTAVVAPDDATPADNTSTAVTTVTQPTGGGGGTTGGGGGGTPTFTGGGGTLAFTGVPVGRWMLAAGALLLVGTGLVLLGSRKPSSVE